MAANKKKSKGKAKLAVKAKAKSKIKAKPKVKLQAKGKAKAKAKLKTVKGKISTKAKPKSALDFKSLLIPLDDRLLVRIEGPSEMTVGGIIIPGTVSDRPNRGQVIAAGRGRRNRKGMVRPIDVSVGDSVLFAQYAGQPVTIKENEFLILREEDVLGVVS